MENISQMSLIEVAVSLMEKKQAPQNIYSLIKEVLQIKGLDETNIELATQLYVDLISSSKFVYMGNDEWDLKLRQSLDQFDKDGSAFNPKVSEEDEEEEILEAEDDDLKSDDEYSDDEDNEDSENEDDEYSDDYDNYDPSAYTQDDYDEDNDDSVDHYDDEFDEDKYNDLMDDYEIMYEE